MKGGSTHKDHDILGDSEGREGFPQVCYDRPSLVLRHC